MFRRHRYACADVSNKRCALFQGGWIDQDGDDGQVQEVVASHGRPTLGRAPNEVALATGALGVYGFLTCSHSLGHSVSFNFGP